MKHPTAAGVASQSTEGEKKSVNSELWHACAGPRVSLPPIGSLVVYFAQGHSEQVTVSTQKEVDGHIPNYPNLPSQLICELHNVVLHADTETDEVFAQMTLQPVNAKEKDLFIPPDLILPNRQPTDFFCKTLTASDTSTHGGFSVPRRSAEKVFPSLDFSKQPPSQELLVKDLHDQIWRFRHIYRGQPKRHLLTTGWSVFVSAKRLVAGDSVLFIRDEKGQLLLGIRRANRQQTVMPSSVLSSDSMHIGVLAAAAHAASTSSRFLVFYNPRASPLEFVIPLAKYNKAIYGAQVSVGTRFRMVFETEDSTLRRYMGTITGVSDLDPVRWPSSQWRNLEVGWDESSSGERPRRVSAWEIEPIVSSSPFLICTPPRPKRPRIPGLLGDDMDLDGSMQRCLAWLRGEASNSVSSSSNSSSREIEASPSLSPDAWMRLQQRVENPVTSAQLDFHHLMVAAAGLQDFRVGDPSQMHFGLTRQHQSFVAPPQQQSFVAPHQQHSLSVSHQQQQSAPNQQQAVVSHQQQSVPHQQQSFVATHQQQQSVPNQQQSVPQQQESVPQEQKQSLLHQQQSVSHQQQSLLYQQQSVPHQQQSMPHQQQQSMPHQQQQRLPHQQQQSMPRQQQQSMPHQQQQSVPHQQQQSLPLQQQSVPHQQHSFVVPHQQQQCVPNQKIQSVPHQQQQSVPHQQKQSVPHQQQSFVVPHQQKQSVPHQQQSFVVPHQLQQSMPHQQKQSVSHQQQLPPSPWHHQQSIQISNISSQMPPHLSSSPSSSASQHSFSNNPELNRLPVISEQQSMLSISNSQNLKFDHISADITRPTQNALQQLQQASFLASSRESQITWLSPPPLTDLSHADDAPLLSNNMQMPQYDVSSSSPFAMLPSPELQEDSDLLIPTMSNSLSSRSFNTGKDVHVLSDNANVLPASFPSPSASFQSSSVSFSSPSASDISMNAGIMGSGGLDEALLQQSCSWPPMPAPFRTYTKVQKLGSVGRSLDISRFKNYDELRYELARMFNLEGQLEDPHRSSWQLVFVDNEGDVLLVGDDPWEEFVSCVRIIRILSPAEVIQMSQQGIELLGNTIPLTNNHHRWQDPKYLITNSSID